METLFLLLMVLLQRCNGNLSAEQENYLGNYHLLPTEQFLGLYTNNKTLGFNIIGSDILKTIIGDRNVFSKYLDLVLGSVGSSEIKGYGKQIQFIHSLKSTVSLPIRTLTFEFL